MHFMTISILLLLLTGSAMAQNETLTARQRFDEIAAQVKDKHGGDFHLITVMAIPNLGGLPVSADARSGKAHNWIYAFYDAGSHRIVSAMALSHPVLGDFSVVNDPEEAPVNDTLLAIPENWLDSDAAAAAWKLHGLQEFFNVHPNAKTVALMLFGKTATWSAQVADNTDSLECIIDAVSAALVSCDLLTYIPDQRAMLNFGIGSPYPNPARQGAAPVLEVQSLSVGEVRVAVHDITGRLQDKPIMHRVQPGSTALVIPSELFPRPGVYFIRVTQNDMTVSRRMIVIP
jgi:hypothetical protein